MDILREILNWVDQQARPNSRRRYSRCPICDLSWWGTRERHQRDCFVPRLRRIVNAEENVRVYRKENETMKSSKFDRDFARMEKFISVWFVFVALLALALTGGGIYVIYRPLLHFGVF